MDSIFLWTLSNSSSVNIHFAIIGWFVTINDKYSDLFIIDNHSDTHGNISKSLISCKLSTSLFITPSLSKNIAFCLLLLFNLSTFHDNMSHSTCFSLSGVHISFIYSWVLYHLNIFHLFIIAGKICFQKSDDSLDGIYLNTSGDKIYNAAFTQL
jgi:hypothetical protein